MIPKAEQRHTNNATPRNWSRASRSSGATSLAAGKIYSRSGPACVAATGR